MPESGENGQPGELAVRYPADFKTWMEQDLLDGQNDDRDFVGDLFSNYKLCWIACGAKLVVVNVGNCSIRSMWTFERARNDSNATIICATELPVSNYPCSLLLVGLQTSIGSQISVYNAFTRCVLRTFKFNSKITTMAVIDDGESVVNPLPNILDKMEGVLAVGCDDGSVMLLDLCRSSMNSVLSGDYSCLTDDSKPCNLCFIDCLVDNASTVKAKMEYCAASGDSLALPLNVGERGLFVPYGMSPSSVTSMRYCREAASLLVGYSTGSWQLWNLTSFDLLYTSPRATGLNTLVFDFCVLEPCDDPRHTLYIWVTHQPLSTVGSASSSPESSYLAAANRRQFQINNHHPFTVMYTVHFDSKNPVKDYGSYYQNFLVCTQSFRMDLSLDNDNEVNAKVVSCSAVSKQLTRNTINCADLPESDCSSLRLFTNVWEAWNEDTERIETLVSVFDLNQWYKEQMPSDASLASRDECCPFLNSSALRRSNALNVALLPDSFLMYTSVHPIEQHFYPSALSFDCVMIDEDGLVKFRVNGTQRQMLKDLSSYGGMALLRPNSVFRAVVNSSIVPVYGDPLDADHSDVVEQRNYILTVCMENNLSGVVLECADLWYNGSHSVAGCTLAYLLHFLWDMFSTYKNNFGKISEPLFDQSGVEFDTDSKRRLQHCRTILYSIESVYSKIVAKYSSFIMSDNVEQRLEAMKLILFYYENITWFMNMGLLPEQSWKAEPSSTIPYNFNKLFAFCSKRRDHLKSLPPVLYGDSHKGPLFLIDALLQEKAPRALEQWAAEGGHSGGRAYPPSSLQSLLRTALIAELPTKVKHSIITYFLLDFVDVIDNEVYRTAIENILNYRYSFGIPEGQSRVVQAFWHLDHCYFEDGVQCLLDPSVAGNDLQEWEHRTVLRCLVAQSNQRLALKYLHFKRPALNLPDDIRLEMSLLLSNNLVNQAFMFQRHHEPLRESLLKQFFAGCLDNSNMKAIYSLPLDSYEEEVFMNFLKTSSLKKSGSLQVLYLVTRAKYLEAIELNEKLNSYGRGTTGSTTAVAATSLAIFGQKRHPPSSLLSSASGSFSLRPEDPIGGVSTCHATDLLVKGIAGTITSVSRQMAAVSSSQLLPNTINRLTGKRLQPLSVTLRTTEEVGGISNFKNSEGDVIASALAHTHHLWKHLLETPQPLRKRLAILDKEDAEEAAGPSRKVKRRPEDDKTMDGEEEEEVEEELLRSRKQARLSPSFSLDGECRPDSPLPTSISRRAEDKDDYYEEVERLVSTPLVKRWGHKNAMTTPVTSSQPKPASILKLSQKRIGVELDTPTAPSTPVLRPRRKGRGATPVPETPAQPTPSKMLRFKLPSGSPEMPAAASASAEEEPSSVQIPVETENEPVMEEVPVVEEEPAIEEPRLLSKPEPTVLTPSRTFKVSARKSLRALREDSLNRSKPSSASASTAEVPSTSNTPQPQLESYRDRLRTRSATKSPGGLPGTPRRKTPDVKAKKNRKEEAAEEEEDWQAEAENSVNRVLFTYESVSSSVKKSTRRTTSNKSPSSAPSGLVPRVLFKKQDDKEEHNTMVTKMTETIEKRSVVETLTREGNGNEEKASIEELIDIRGEDKEEVQAADVDGEETTDRTETRDNTRGENYKRRSFVEEIMMARDEDESRDDVEDRKAEEIDEQTVEEDEREGIEAKKVQEESDQEEEEQVENVEKVEDEVEGKDRGENNAEKVEEEIKKEEDKCKENKVEMTEEENKVEMTEEENKVEMTEEENKVEMTEEENKVKMTEEENKAEKTEEEEEREESKAEKIGEEEQEVEKNEAGKEEDIKPEESETERVEQDKTTEKLEPEEDKLGENEEVEKSEEPETEAGKEVEKEDVRKIDQDAVQMEVVAGQQERSEEGIADAQEVEYEVVEDEEEEEEEIEEEEEEEEEGDEDNEDEEQREESDGPYLSDNEQRLDFRRGTHDEEEEMEVQTREVEALIRKRGLTLDTGPFHDGRHRWAGTSHSSVKWIMEKVVGQMSPETVHASGPSTTDNDVVIALDLDREDDPLYAETKDILISELDELNRQDQLEEAEEEDIYAGLDDDIILADGKPPILDENDEEEEAEDEDEEEEEAEEEESSQDSEEEVGSEEEDEDEEEGSVICLDSEDEEEKDQSDKDEGRSQNEEEEAVVLTKEEIQEESVHASNSSDATQDSRKSAGVADDATLDVNAMIGYSSEMGVKIVDTEEYVHNSSLEVEQGQERRRPREKQERAPEATEHEQEEIRPSPVFRQEIVIKEVFSIEEESALEEISCTGIVQLADETSPGEDDAEEGQGETVDEKMEPDEGKEGELVDAVAAQITTEKHSVENDDRAETAVTRVTNPADDNNASPGSFNDSEEVNVADMAMIYSDEDSRDTVEFSLTHGDTSVAESPREASMDGTVATERILRMKARSPPPPAEASEKLETTPKKGRRGNKAVETPKKEEPATPRRARRKTETPETTPRRGRSSKSIRDDELEEILKIGNAPAKKSTVDRSMMTERKTKGARKSRGEEKEKEEVEEEGTAEKKDEDMKLSLDLEEETAEAVPPPPPPADNRHRRSSSLQPPEPRSAAAAPTILKKKKSVSISDFREIIPDPEEERRAMTRRRRSMAEHRLGADAPPSSSEEEPEEDRAERRRRRSVEAAGRLRRRTLEAEARRRISNFLEQEEREQQEARGRSGTSNAGYGIPKQRKSVTASDPKEAARWTSDLPEEEARGASRSSSDYGIRKQRKSVTTSDLREVARRTSNLPEEEARGAGTSSADYGTRKQRKSVSTSDLREAVCRSSDLPEEGARGAGRSSADYGTRKHRKSVSASDLREAVRRTSYLADRGTAVEEEDRHRRTSFADYDIGNGRKSVSTLDLRETARRTSDFPEEEARGAGTSSAKYGIRKDAQRKSVSISDLREIIPEDRPLRIPSFGNRYPEEEYRNRGPSRDSGQSLRRYSSETRLTGAHYRPIEDFERERQEVRSRRSMSMDVRPEDRSTSSDVDKKKTSSSTRHSTQRYSGGPPLPPILEDNKESVKISRRTPSSREDELFRPIEPAERTSSASRKRRAGSVSGFPVGKSSSSEATATKRRSLKRRLTLLEDIAEETTSLCELELDVTDMEAELAIAKDRPPATHVPDDQKRAASKSNRLDVTRENMIKKWIGDQERRKNQKKRLAPKFKTVDYSSDEEVPPAAGRGVGVVHEQQDKEVDDLVRAGGKLKGTVHHHHHQQQHLEEDTMSIASSETSMGKLLRSGRMVDDTPTPPKKKRPSRASLGQQQDEKKPLRATNRSASSPTPSPTSSLVRHNLTPPRARDSEQNSEQSGDEANNISVSSRTRSSTRQKQKKKL